MIRKLVAISVLALVESVSAAPFDLQSKILEAQPGTIINVPAGVYGGVFVIDRALTLNGETGSVLQGTGDGDVVRIEAEGVTIRGFEIRGTGISLDRENAGITVLAPRVTIENNIFTDVLFGVYLKAAPNSVIRGNHISGMNLSLPRRGDGIRIWESSGTLIEDNVVVDSRDVVIWFSDDVTLRRNRVSGGRYGMHFMYCDDNVLEDNWLANNSVGAFLMYSKNLVLVGNTFARNRGPSGYGVGLKDMDGVVARDNILVGNRIGLSLDNSPSSVDSRGVFERNVFAYNDHGIAFMPSVKRNHFTGNSFLDNLEQIAILGGGRLTGNVFNENGRGNFWSDYRGLDMDHDGVGDIAYTPMSLFGDLMDREPRLKLFQFSPAQQAVDFAARAVPAVRPRPKITDQGPLVRPIVARVAGGGGESREMAILAAVVAILPVLTLGIASLNSRRHGKRPTTSTIAKAPALEDRPMIEIEGVTKRFGRIEAVKDASLCVAKGESVALCGPNGAGKTTLLRCVLGLHPYKGDIQVAGISMSKKAKLAKRHIGYVPQELAFYSDLTVRQTLNFFCKLKGVSRSRGPVVLREVGLAGQEKKRVGALSGGMKQKLALATAMLADPPILVLDEPTSNLDVEARASFLSLLSMLHCGGKTILFTSHRPEEVAALAQRVVNLKAGAITRMCTPEELARSQGHRHAVDLTVAGDRTVAAIDLLTSRGIQAKQVGRMMIRAEVDAQDKVAPIIVLTHAGIRIETYGLHSHNGVQVDAEKGGVL